jgi:mono/diheme cytochrome c family protein
MRISTPSKISYLLAGLAGLHLATLGPCFAQAAPDPKIVRAWKAKCASCHGEDGKAQTDQGTKMGIRDVTQAAWQKAFTDDQIQQAILDGLKRTKDGKQQEMEPFRDKLRPDQVQGLLAYIRGLGK